MALSIRGFDIVRKIPSIFPLFSNEGVTQAVQIPQFFTRLFLVGVNDVRNNGGKSTRTQNTVTGVLVLFLSKSGGINRTYLYCNRLCCVRIRTLGCPLIQSNKIAVRYCSLLLGLKGEFRSSAGY